MLQIPSRSKGFRDIHQIQGSHCHCWVTIRLPSKGTVRTRWTSFTDGTWLLDFVHPLCKGLVRVLICSKWFGVDWRLWNKPTTTIVYCLFLQGFCFLKHISLPSWMRTNNYYSHVHPKKSLGQIYFLMFTSFSHKNHDDEPMKLCQPRNASRWGTRLTLDLMNKRTALPIESMGLVYLPNIYPIKINHSCG